MLDDHVFWSPSLLTSILCPFNTPAGGSKIGLFGTNTRVRRRPGLTLWPRIWNMLGSLYLERHNFETCATNAIDGGVFVVSARTLAIRTSILYHPDFLAGYVHETFLFGLLAPLNPDDDNFDLTVAGGVKTEEATAQTGSASVAMATISKIEPEVKKVIRDKKVRSSSLMGLQTGRVDDAYRYKMESGGH
ncbi:hypothetical protein B0H66DRAFT_596389 [Apodospora peruviana]|uniref:Uncharacterized protein n=1 Tax=Apodospora peruviana TaxID=516989 RepID=A0AAE0MEH3_9PEZI|nr:hypothetical protein B0H66DRAFT_596389 [Apodospora peruviana]